MIEFRRISKISNKKKQEIDASKDMSFTVNRNDIFGVVGYNGAGKSTLMRLMNRLEAVSDRQVVVNGHDITNYNDKMMRNIKKDIGMVFQHFNLLNPATIFKNVAMPLVLSEKSKIEIKQRIAEMLESVGLSDKKDQFPGELSDRQKQRVVITRALVTNPKILLYDKATSALGPVTTASILTLPKNVNQTFGITVMMITRGIRVIKDVCSRIAVMEEGKVVETGTVKEVFNHLKAAITQNFVSAVIQTKSSASLIHRSNDEQVGGFKDYKTFVEETQVTQPIINDLIRICSRKVKVLSSSVSGIQGSTVCYMWLRFNMDQQFKDMAIS